MMEMRADVQIRRLLDPGENLAARDRIIPQIPVRSTMISAWIDFRKSIGFRALLELTADEANRIVYSFILKSENNKHVLVYYSTEI